MPVQVTCKIGRNLRPLLRRDFLSEMNDRLPNRMRLVNRNFLNGTLFRIQELKTGLNHFGRLLVAAALHLKRDTVLEILVQGDTHSACLLT